MENEINLGLTQSSTQIRLPVASFIFTLNLEEPMMIGHAYNVVETAPSERILNGVTSAVSTCGISIVLIIHSLDPSGALL